MQEERYLREERYMRSDERRMISGAAGRRHVSRWTTAAVLAALVMLPASLAFAQEPNVEISFFGGYTFSEGIKTDPGSLVGAVIDEVNPTSGPSYGVGVDVFVTDVASIGFRLGRQDSNLEVKGTTTRELASMTLNHYHGVFTYHFGSSDLVQPFFFGGAGVTDVSFGDVMGFAIEGDSKLSSTWGGGVKVFPTPRVGLPVTGHWRRHGVRHRG